MPALAELIAALEARYPPTLAESWDAVGLVCGDPAADVGRVMFAVDPVASVVDEAIEVGADLLVTHHPLFLSAVHGVPADDPKGRLVHRLITAGCALFVAHTNADRARPGVSDALAHAVGLRDVEPLEPAETTSLDTIVTFVPPEAADLVVDALAAAGAGHLGDYARAAFGSAGIGTFEPLDGANPTIGRVGVRERVEETRIEMMLPRERRAAVTRALRAAHPYEEPAFSIVELAALPSSQQGLGRIGLLDSPIRLRDFVSQVAGALPATVAGVRAAGDPDRMVQRVAVCGGSGGSLIGAARAAGADAFLTADLKHHQVSEALEVSDLALIDATHWATEWPWLPAAAARLGQDVRERVIQVTVSGTRTDPWSAVAHSDGTSR